MTTYTCAKCNKPVRVVDAKIIRDCDCKEPVIAHLTAVATGEARVNK